MIKILLTNLWLVKRVLAFKQYFRHFTLFSMEKAWFGCPLAVVKMARWADPFRFRHYPVCFFYIGKKCGHKETWNVYRNKVTKISVWNSWRLAAINMDFFLMKTIRLKNTMAVYLSWKEKCCLGPGENIPVSVVSHYSIQDFIIISRDR